MEKSLISTKFRSTWSGSGVNHANNNQPNKPLFSNNKVAVETVDPYLHPVDDDECPGNFRCRYSDAAFAKLDSVRNLDPGRVVTPLSIGETEKDDISRGEATRS